MSDAVNRTGASVVGVGVGVLHIESHFPLVHGHLQNARSLGVPLIYECVTGVSPRQIVACEPAVEEPLVAAARRLVGRGAKAVVGTCGSFINYHGALVRAGLVDEVNVEFLPALIGGLATPSLFDSPALESDETPTRLKLISTQTQAEGRVWLRYAVIRD